MSGKKIPAVVIIGPTASGKSALAVELARLIGGEIISGDSMQVYRGMDIGTAKPSERERGGIRHHLIDILDIDRPFSCADFTSLATECAKDICSRGKIPVIAGGTGLYIEMLISGTQTAPAPADARLRAELYAYASENGNGALWKRLEEIDPDAAAGIHPNNVKRVVRAIEVYRTTGETKTEQDRLSRCSGSPFAPFVVCLSGDRDVIYSRIDSRFDLMLEQGLEDEVRALCARGLEDAPTASQAIGYKEFFPYIHGTAGFDEAVEEAKKSSRNYAKRQLTYFRRMHADMFADMLSDKCETSVNIADMLSKAHL